MAGTLEDRRLAIAAALRAVMAEPLPERFRPEPAPEPAPPSPPAVSVDSESQPAAPEPIVVRSLREALIAGIDWDEPDETAGATTTSDRVDITDAPDVAVIIGLPVPDPDPEVDHLNHADSADDEDDDSTPSIPPLDLGGSMSSRASMALFGHA